MAKSAPKSAPRKSSQPGMKQLLEAQSKAQMASAKAEQARANVEIVRAKISAAGKQLVWDPKTGAEKIISR